ncbi:proteasome inhibitor PI31 subunit [Phlebotomus argentipes]|uniref:proteasome inhibitor PI31 subunit n=1 Tax=Phlebotomus argentipes TaxID=94469 RepID=UPI00289347AD|nr:proteasome inhibitor PI31 subunit [Phlebotomus argentipes]
MESDYFGWSLLLRTIANDIRSDLDVLVAVIHWHMTRNGFSCLSIGDDKTLADTDRGSELLPEDWSSQGDVYKLRYLRRGELFILTALQTQEVALFNLLSVKSQEVTNVQFNVGETVRARSGNLTEVLNDAPNVLKKIDEEFLTPKANQTPKEPSRSPPQRNPLLEDRGIGINRGIPDPFSVGRGDLDPLGRLGGGMLFPGPGHGHFPPPGGFRDPGFGIPGGLPPGAVPPGARFDPFAPLPTNPGRPRRLPGNPDNDHLPPPGYDDMFM